MVASVWAITLCTSGYTPTTLSHPIKPLAGVLISSCVATMLLWSRFTSPRDTPIVFPAPYDMTFVPAFHRHRKVLITSPLYNYLPFSHIRTNSMTQYTIYCHGCGPTFWPGPTVHSHRPGDFRVAFRVASTLEK
jgi:hypothetical protein